jgi:ankyrin repeat protein
MSKSRYARLLYTVAIILLLLNIGRTFYLGSLNEQLVVAVKREQVDSVRSLLAKGADANYNVLPPEGSGPARTILSTVVMTPSRNKDDIACLLIAHGADIHGSHGSAAMEAACASGNISVVQALLARGVDPRLMNKDTLVGNAIGYGWYYRSYLDPNDVEIDRRLRSRALVALLREHGLALTLEQAATVNDCEALQAALKAGTPFNADEGGRALQAAASSGSLDAARWLLAHGANVNTANQHSWPPLTCAIYNHHAHMVALLLARGANVNVTGEPSTIAIGVAIRSMPAIVPQLLKHGADINAGDGSTFANAIQRLDRAMIALMLQRGVHLQGKRGYRALLAAVQFKPDLVALLLKRGASAREYPGDRDSLLWQAVHAGHGSLVSLLISAGANVNAATSYGPVVTEAIVRAPETVNLLLERGANANAMSPMGDTPLTMAARAGNAEAGRLLLAHGANVNASTPHGHTPLYWASKHGHAAMVVLLRHHGAH